MSTVSTLLAEKALHDDKKGKTKKLISIIIYNIVLDIIYCFMLKYDKKEIIEIRKLDAKNKVAYPIKETIITRIKKQTKSQTINVIIIIFL